MPAIQLPHDTYDEWRSALLDLASQGLGVDFDGYYGYQCADLGSELWWLFGQTFTLGGGLYVYLSWANEAARSENGSGNFSLVYNLSDIKRGDMCIWNTNTIGGIAGHNAFADEDYNGQARMNFLGQNQVNPNEYTGHVPTITSLPVTGILGAFRCNSWNGGEPPTPPSPPLPPAGATLKSPESNIVILKRCLQLRRKRL